MSWKSSDVQTGIPAWHTVQLLCTCLQMLENIEDCFKTNQHEKTNCQHTQKKISSRREACSKSYLFVSTHPCACLPALMHQMLATTTYHWCCNERWLQVCLVLHPSGNPCQVQWLHQSTTSMQGSSSFFSSYWRKHQAKPNSLVSPLLGLFIHTEMPLVSFTTLLFGGDICLGEDTKPGHAILRNIKMIPILWWKHCFAQVGTGVVPPFPPLDQKQLLRAISPYAVRSHTFHELQRCKCPSMLQKWTAEKTKEIYFLTQSYIILQ